MIEKAEIGVAAAPKKSDKAPSPGAVKPKGGVTKTAKPVEGAPTKESPKAPKAVAKAPSAPATSVHGHSKGKGSTGKFDHYSDAR